MPELDKTSIELLRLRDLTDRFGNIAELQYLQLRNWMILLDPKIYPKKIDVTIDTLRKRIEYSIRSAQKDWKPNADYEHRLSVLYNAVKWLLGPAYYMKVTKNDTQVFPPLPSNLKSATKNVKSKDRNPVKPKPGKPRPATRAKKKGRSKN